MKRDRYERGKNEWVRLERNRNWRTGGRDVKGIQE